MPSLQQSAGSGKAAKFVQANPFGPMADPFQGMVRNTVFENGVVVMFDTIESIQSN